MAVAFFTLSVFLPKALLAALTSPSIVVGGDQYANDSSLGKISQRNWRSENQKSRKIVYVNPNDKTPTLFAGYVNEDSTACANTVDGGVTIKRCRLEFKMSIDNGMTWSQAISSSQTWLDIEVINSAIDPTLTNYSPEFSIILSPNNQDIWVAYKTYSTDINNNISFGQESQIAKLTWDASTSKWKIGTIRKPSVPIAPTVPNINTETNGWCNYYSTYRTSLPTVFVENLSDGTERVWAILQCLSLHGPAPAYHSHEYYPIYNDDFSNSNDWTVAKSGGSPLQIEYDNYPNPPGTYGYAPPKMTFIPLGSNKLPSIISAREQFVAGENPCVKIFTKNNDISADSWTATYKCAVSVVPEKDTKLFDFSIAAYPTSTDQSRFVVAYEGGYDVASGGAISYENKTRIRSCLFTNSGTSGCKAAIISGSNFFTNAYSPSVGFFNSKAFIALRDSGTGNLITSEESADYSTWPPADYTWVDASSHSSSATTQTPSVPVYVYDGKITLNSGLWPIMWLQTNNKKVVFSENIGGTVIGPNLPAYPVLGWGWSSNFGWLSLNCVNRISSDLNVIPNCNPAYGVGVGIASSNVPAGNAFSAPDGYPLGGYAWSSNAGLVSFERKDSVNSTNNPYGNPANLPYNNSANANDPIIKYDTTAQKIHGWGRFLNLCNFDNTSKCKDKEKGWLKMQGYWLKPGVKCAIFHNTNNTVTFSNAFPGGCTDYAKFDIGGGIIVVDGDYYQYTSRVSNKLNGISPNIGLAPDDRVDDMVYAASGTDPDDPPGCTGSACRLNGGPYGVQAFWNGSNYEFSGWGWSDDYGWIAFRPLIFVGYAWMESLFGNIYSGGAISLPKPENKSGTPIMCDYNNDGVAESECVVSTYRIEAGGNISTFNPPGTSYTTKLPTSGYGGNFGPENRLLGNLENFFDSNLLTTGSGNADLYSLNTSESTVVYRNALGKLDLTGLISYSDSNLINYFYETDPSTAKQIKLGLNRFGNTVWENVILPESNIPSGGWTTSLLGGLSTFGKWQDNHPTLESFQNEVVHITTDLTIDGGSGVWASKAGDWTSAAGGTLTISGATGNFSTPADPATGSSPPLQKALCSTCALVIDPNTANEEYVSYTSFSGSTFNGVRTINGIKTHSGAPIVRSAWRLPYTSGEANAQTVTFVVDGNLNINYNIIGSNPSNPQKIRDLPTVAFIVKGNVNIDPAVNKVTGAFVALGPASQFNTGNDYGYCPQGTALGVICNPLEVVGLVMAKSFSLERYGAKDLSKPGEKFVYDSSLFLNPPPGLNDLSKALANPTRTQP